MIMPAFERKAYNKGINEGIEIGKSEGIEIGKNEGIDLGFNKAIDNRIEILLKENPEMTRRDAEIQAKKDLGIVD